MSQRFFVLASASLLLIMAACSPPGESASRDLAPKTREVEVTREIPVEVTREVEVTRRVPVTVITQPTSSPVPSTQSFSGGGDDVVSCNLQSGNNFVEFTHSGQGHFAVWIHDSEGGRDLLVNESGRYEGLNFVNTETRFPDLVPGNCILEITADGSWTAEIRGQP